MKLKEVNEAIATACNVRPNVVNSVQAETFKQLRAALEKGEKVIIPGFGHFVTREVPGKDGEPAKKSLRFKLKTEAEQEEQGQKNKEKRKAKKAAAAEAAGNSGEAASEEVSE